MSFRLLLATSFTALLSFGCAAPLRCPASGGAPWTELTSAHLILRTDAPAASARRLVAEYEALHGALAYVTERPRSADGEKVTFVHFDRRDDFDEITGHLRARKAYFTPSTPGDFEPEPTMVAQAELPDDARETFLHELTHRFLHERFGAIPTWLNEGMAQYYATITVESGRVVLGATGDLDFSDRPVFWTSWRGSSMTTQVPVLKAPALWTLLNGNRTTFYAADAAPDPTNPPRDAFEQHVANYAAAWKIVHYFLAGPDDRDRALFLKFLGAVQRGERARDAFLTVFGLEMPRLQAALRRHLTATQPNVRVAKYQGNEAPPSVAERTMADAEVHLLWARLMPWKKGSMEAVRHQLDEALAQGPAMPDVHYRRARFHLHEAQLDAADRELRAALDARPDEPRYLLARIFWHDQRAEAPGAPANERVPADLVRRFAGAAASPYQLCLAADLEGRRHGSTGLELVDRALARAPVSFWCHFVRAKLLADAGKLEEALTAVDRAIAFAPEKASTENLFALRRRIELANAAAPRPRAGESEQPSPP